MSRLLRLPPVPQYGRFVRDSSLDATPIRPEGASKPAWGNAQEPGNRRGTRPEMAAQEERAAPSGLGLGWTTESRGCTRAGMFRPLRGKDSSEAYPNRVVMGEKSPLFVAFGKNERSDLSMSEGRSVARGLKAFEEELQRHS